MEAAQLSRLWSDAQGSSRPPCFLVSTPSTASDLAGNLGSADYSYGFVLQALKPVLQSLGPVRLISQPESRLVPASLQATKDGFFPIHVCLSPPHRAYLTPALPNILVPFWEFPRIPDRDFARDTRQNWARIASRADLIVTACRLTADAFTRAKVACPIQVIPVPLSTTDFEIPPWSPTRIVRLHCRHTVWHGSPDPRDTAASASASPPPESAAHNTAARIELALKRRYNRIVRPWLSDKALDEISHWKNTLLLRYGGPPRLPLADLDLSGITYTSVFNLGDLRKNPSDMLSAFLLALGHRPEVTLVLKLAANPATEASETRALRKLLDSLGIPFRCRIVVIPDFLQESALRDLFTATTYYLNTSRAEGACLPLQRALAAGRPAIAPAHTAMADYVDPTLAFVVDSHPEPACWPHDPQKISETTWHRLVWSSLHDQIKASAELLDHSPDLAPYEWIASNARQRMLRQFHPDTITLKWREAITTLRTNPRPLGALDWAS